MRNKLVAAAIAGLVAVPAGAQAESEVSWFGFSQITAHTTDEYTGAEGDANGGGLAFGADRIRIGYKADHTGGAHSKLQVDFLQTGTNQVANIIKDAVVGYKLGNVDIQAGMRKTPIGMDFNTSGKKLDIVNRGMEKSWVFERSAGAFVFGDAGPLGYAVFLTNPASRGAAAGHDDPDTPGTTEGWVLGEDMAYGGRLSYDMGKMLHAEISYGVSTMTYDNVGIDTTGNGNIDTSVAADDLTNLDIGLKSQPMPGLTLKAEYLAASGVGNVEDQDRTVWFVHGGYEFTPMMEGVVRHYSSNADNGTDDWTLSETYLGLNIFLNPEVHHESRIQVNYILPSGDTDEMTGLHRTGTVSDEDGEQVGTIKAMFQTSF